MRLILIFSLLLAAVAAQELPSAVKSALARSQTDLARIEADLAKAQAKAEADRKAVGAKLVAVLAQERDRAAAAKKDALVAELEALMGSATACGVAAPPNLAKDKWWEEIKTEEQWLAVKATKEVTFKAGDLFCAEIHTGVMISPRQRALILPCPTDKWRRKFMASFGPWTDWTGKGERTRYGHGIPLTDISLIAVIAADGKGGFYEISDPLAFQGEVILRGNTPDNTTDLIDGQMRVKIVVLPK